MSDTYSTGYYTAPGGWEFVDPEDNQAPRSRAAHRSSNPARDQHQDDDDTDSASQKPQESRRRHYSPRTCRICLETVLPTFHTPSENLPGWLQGQGYVTYDSELGRLIRPCKCKGSSRYVHESCLQEWRHADKDYGARNYYQCPTCGFKYRLQRMEWGLWLKSGVTQVGLTLVIFLATIFALGFVADPIINMYLDPWSTIVPDGPPVRRPSIELDDEDTWFEHFLKGFASLGVLGMVKVFFTINPLNWWQLRGGGYITSRGRGVTGRDRMASINWFVLLVGVLTFVYTVWKAVRAWSRRTLTKASERVMDVQGDETDADDDENEGGDGDGADSERARSSNSGENQRPKDE